MRWQKKAENSELQVSLPGGGLGREQDKIPKALTP